ncbi:MAG TPA: gamma-glutamyl-gamma-aminobutyrate hydrolase family protein [Candidatus Lokiarchaeia archaeon]|nr:gamma-glutamyl-gamma-aminobutyrate hydrolase family protein [Candidatus Lokiarchaeia archaeon]
MKKILILDCGSRFIDRLENPIHDENAETAILTVPMQGNVRPVEARYPIMHDIAAIDEIEPAGVVISGSPYYIYTKQGRVPPAGFLETIMRKKLPLLGICGGHELLAHLFALQYSKEQPSRVVGANPLGKHEPEVITSNPCEFTRDLDNEAAKSCGNIIFDGLSRTFPVWMYHVHQVLVLPSNCISLGSTPDTAIAAIAYCKPLEPVSFMFGVQFHPEVSPRKTRRQIFSNFVGLCAD